MTPASFPRVALPGVSPEATAEVDALVSAARLERAEKTRHALRCVVSLHRKGKHIYKGTVSPQTKARRRAAEKMARASRRASR